MVQADANAYDSSEKVIRPVEQTATFFNPSGGATVFLCSINGIPIYGPIGCRNFTVTLPGDLVERTQSNGERKPEEPCSDSG